MTERPFELVPPKKKKRNLEESMCCGFWRAFQMQYPKLVCVTTHFPAGGLRTAKTGKLMKDLGTQAGFPDYQVMVAKGGFHGLFLEFKTNKNRLTANQKFRMEALRGQGYACAVVRSVDQAFAVIDLYLNNTYFPRPDFEYKPFKEQRNERLRQGQEKQDS